jgi:UDP-glucose 4-epimerase
MKIQILGSNGYIGKNFTHYLSSDKNLQLELFDIQGNSLHQNLQYSSLNITNKEQIESIQFNSDYIFIFSGLTGTNIGFTKYDEYIKVNEIGLVNILDELKNQNYKGRVVFPSTRLVYKGQKDVPLTEEAEKDFKTPYAINKYACEQYLKMYSNLYGLNYTVFRICVPYANSVGLEYSYGTVGFFLNKALNGDDIVLYGDGSQKRTFSHTNDICSKMWQAVKLSESKNDIFNIGGETLSLLEAAQIVADKFGVGVKFVDWPEIDLKLESGDTIFDSNKLDSLLRENYKYNFREWISDLKI